MNEAVFCVTTVGISNLHLCGCCGATQMYKSWLIRYDTATLYTEHLPMVLFALCFQSRLTMEDRTDSPMAVKVERHSQYVILTYFQGDINSMVDAHFTRALGNVCKAKAPAAKTKKIRKTIKLGKHTESFLTEGSTFNPVHPPYMLSVFVPLQRTPALVRGVLLTLTTSHKFLQDVSWPSALQTTLLKHGSHSLPGQEKARGCRPSRTPCPKKGWL